MNKTTWILAAHRGGAKLYQSTEPGSLVLLRDIPHPEGDLQNRDINTDRHGRTAEMGGLGGPKGTEVDATEAVAMEFARSLAAILQKGRTSNAYRALVLVAEPRFLGRLRAVLDAPTAALIIGDMNKELTKLPTEELRTHLHRENLI